MEVKKIVFSKWSVVLACLFLASLLPQCGLQDVKDIENYQTTQENLEQGANGGTAAFMTGVMEYCANMADNCFLTLEAVSDNYDNTYVSYSQSIDTPREVLYLDINVGYAMDPTYELRSLADFTLNSVWPNDEEATAEQKAELYFYRGLATLVLGENWVAAAVEEGGVPKTPTELFQLALADFDAAIAASQHTGFATRIAILKARVYRDLGDKTNALAQAELALTSGPGDYVFGQDYDSANNQNGLWLYTNSRSDWQVLPRLDFLDTKYPTDNTPIPLVKMEEAHLIKAEVQLSNGDYTGAKQTLKDLIALVDTRPTSTYKCLNERYENKSFGIDNKRPQNGVVKFDSSSDPVAGLILPRLIDGVHLMVTTPTVSGTHITADDIDAIGDTDGAEIYYHLYLMRQEIFIYEGRRLSDLGIRLPIMKLELETNPSVNIGDPESVAVVPTYIPPKDEMDWYSVTGTYPDLVVTMRHDVNKILMQNKVSPFTMPF